MGRNALRGRDIWQDASGGKAAAAEHTFFGVFTRAFEGTNFGIRSKPKEFRDVYSKVELSQAILDCIYCPDETWTHGMFPDYAIDNTETGKTLYVEVKRQDGWVEGKARNAGRGNAHERSNKLFTPGLMKMMRERGKLGDDVLPFWVVFQGDIARDPKRVREITFWYGDYNAHFFLWHDSTNDAALLNHFNIKLKPLLL